MFNTNEYKEKIDRFYEIMIKNKEITDIKIAHDKWTLKEMLGHLIDSASNNHQRIMRLQIDKKIVFPVYDAENWKNVTKIKDYDFVELVNFWKSYNYFLLHLAKNLNEDALNNVWEIDGKELTLQFIIEDYFVRHLDWHIELYKDRIEEISA